MAKNYGFAIHTSSPELGLAMGKFGEPVRCQTWHLGRDLSTQLHQHISEFMPPQTWADLQLIAVARGPGSFTGTRLGVVTARTLAQQLDIPLFAISTLAAAAYNLAGDYSGNIALEMPAQRGELFVAIYQVSAQGLVTKLPDSVMSASQWEMRLSQEEKPLEKISLTGGLGQTSCAILGLATLLWQQGNCPHWSDALPFYGQHPVQNLKGD
ncbi:MULTISPECIES: tRNA (adenosine(37)-N6)-threonylcarbamoyltransferase complex dimerization subunit type 1 TsaB [Limnospira]|uniref:Peptidase M22 glycoprotease n=2 Tax=Limnospira TaxID=2596745 RepID=B5W0A1_LIMMA|nr:MULTISPECIES: tRNA (adenosine(37)-N6)-threonylcarbamoyltransferase complex dimerization subunit type 1 TsaB [Limnospira]MDC0840002.1 tRNA (adenosine(37)-N6)-threonylcarbamoyltransferase complex dimerization subunit type 1 TsaB [Limnoraphis robusta]QJB28138.1 tRNA (adenosine(37)-N6)-threonylcarbamoyltransferase complex dimerization subunit type 1 TsaB [Limnospira fusiformis SAG 85.79]EDZ95021.1 peptidase M22 glycoprotease [Limnospira maxima CS-328]MDT9233969.1 tRNA (adenosine(37)-N6)-threonyl